VGTGDFDSGIHPSMSRAPFQVLVFPYRWLNDAVEYAVFKRSDDGNWQAIAGGGEDQESPLDAARREAFEEGQVPTSSPFIILKSVATKPVVVVCGFLWGDDVLVIPEHSFGVDVTGHELTLSSEHSELRWVAYEGAVSLLKWDSNKNALWELDTIVRKRSGKNNIEHASTVHTWCRKRLGAAAVIQDSSGRVLLVKHSYGMLNWELPGGASEDSESVPETAVREVLEETGLNVAAGRLTGIYYDGDVDAHHFVFVCSIVSINTQPASVSAETTQWGYFDPADLPRPISDFTIQRIRDAISGEMTIGVFAIGSRKWLT
jgi:dATP pyrophosphohydrolase